MGETEGYEAAERLLFLTMVLANHFAAEQDLVRQRAMFESALEVFVLPRHQQIMRGYLARCATRAGELDAAEQWLAPCDPRSDDLQSDSAYRFSRAFLDTARGDFDGVLQALGWNDGDVPLVDEMDATAALFRANAWEQRGDMERAVGLLRTAMGEGAGARRAMEGTVERYQDWRLCERSFPLAAVGQRRASVAAARSGMGSIVAWILIAVAVSLGLTALGLVAGGLVCLVIAVVSLIAPLVAGGGEEAWIAGGTVAFSMFITGISLILPGVCMLPFVLLPGWIGRKLLANARKAAELQARGVEAYAEIKNIQPTGMTVNDVPQYRIELRVMPEGGEPVKAFVERLMGPVDAARLQPGTTVPVLVDPEDPTQVIIEVS